MNSILYNDYNFFCDKNVSILNLFIVFSAAVFFCTYEGVKKMFSNHLGAYESLGHMTAAAAGEVVSILIFIVRLD